MDWFLKLPTDVQIPIVGLAGSIIAIITVVVRAKLVPNPARERDFRPKPLEVRLSEVDRELLRGHLRSIGDHAEAIDKHREEMIRGTSAIPRRPRA